LLGGSGDDADDEPLRLEEKLQLRITKQAVALGKAVRDSSPMVVGAALLEHDPDFALAVARYVQRMVEEQSEAERMQEEFGCNPLVLGTEF
jgi:hypothetical protein